MTIFNEKVHHSEKEFQKAHEKVNILDEALKEKDG